MNFESPSFTTNESNQPKHRERIYSPDLEQAELPIEIFYYRNAEGEPMCRVEAQMVEAPLSMREKEQIKKAKTPEEKDAIRPRYLRSLILVHPETGERVNIFEELGWPVIPVRIVTYPKGERNNFYHPNEKGSPEYIQVSGLESPIELSVLLHEFGHADQSHDPKLDRAVKLSDI